MGNKKSRLLNEYDKTWRISRQEFLVVLFIFLLPIMFYWVTWIDCRPISEITSYQNRNYSIPEIPCDAQCFYINHGNFHFSSRKPLSEKPLPTLWILLTLYILGTMLLLFYEVFSYKSKNKDG
ncbi:MAG: hypothetical protein AAF304_06560 [Pseudomonadota bacterium]